MRFRFCGDLDCPDWLLLEISLLSVLESSKVDVITKQIIGCYLEDKFDEEEVLRVAEQNSEDSISDLKGIVASIHFILSNATKYDVDEVSLSQVFPTHHVIPKTLACPPPPRRVTTLYIIFLLRFLFWR